MRELTAVPLESASFVTRKPTNPRSIATNRILLSLRNKSQPILVLAINILHKSGFRSAPDRYLSRHQFGGDDDECIMHGTEAILQDLQKRDR